MKILNKLPMLAKIASIVIFAAFKTEGFADDVPETTEVSNGHLALEINYTYQEKQAGGSDWPYYFKILENSYEYQFQKIHYKSPDQPEDISEDSEIVTNKDQSGKKNEWQYTTVTLPSSRDVYIAWILTATEEDPFNGTFTEIFAKFYLNASSTDNDDFDQTYKTQVYLKPQMDSDGNYLDVDGQVLDISIDENIDKISIFMYSLEFK